jgi:hypothetical protein
MTGAFSPKMVAPEEGKTVMLFGVRFSYKIVSADCGGSLAAMEVEIPARTLVKPHYGITIQDDWIEDLERSYGVKL